MRLKAKTIRKCIALDSPNSSSSPLYKLSENEKLTIVRSKSDYNGLWYYITEGAWIQSKNLVIISDEEFMIKAKKSGLITHRNFSISSLTDSLNLGSIGKSAGIAIASPGGCFGVESSIGPLSNIGNTTFDNLGIGGSGIIGGALKDIELSSLTDGTFFDKFTNNLLDGLFDKLDNWIDSLFNSFFNRLKFVVGFDLEGVLKNYQKSFKLEVDSLDPDPITKTMKKTTSGSSSGLKSGESIPLKPMSDSEASEWVQIFIKSVKYFDYYGCIDQKDKNGEPKGLVVANITDYVSESGKHAKTLYFTDAQEIDFTTYSATIDGKADTNEKHYTDSAPISRRPAAEKEMNIKLFNTDYTEFEDALKTVRSNFNLSLTKEDWLINFNRFRMTHPDYHLVGSLGHVFMTRPDLNLFGDSEDSLNQFISNSDDAAFFAKFVKKDTTLAKLLTKSLTGAHDFIPLIHNTARSIDIQDTSIETLEHGETLTKWKLVYGKDMIKSLTSGEFSINYIDDSKLSISLLHLAWVNYINGVARGIYIPKNTYQKEKILDYASSCYYILTDNTGENIIFWSKYWGVFPTNYPSSSFSMSDGQTLKQPSISINYAYSFRKDMDPAILAEFNRNSENGGNWNYLPLYSPLSGKDGDSNRVQTSDIITNYPTNVGAPFIDTTDSGKTYKLRWRELSDGSGSSSGGFNFRNVITDIGSSLVSEAVNAGINTATGMILDL